MVPKKGHLNPVVAGHGSLSVMTKALTAAQAKLPSPSRNLNPPMRGLLFPA